MTSLEAKILSELRSLQAGDRRGMGDLAEMFSVDAREIRRGIEGLRRAGVNILSSCGKENGYWLSKNDIETKEFFASYHRRALSHFVTEKAMKQQMSFSFDDRT